MKLEVDYRKKNRKNTNTWGPNNILVKKKKMGVNKAIKNKIIKFFEINKNENITI